jgi:hypothetical protein
VSGAAPSRNVAIAKRLYAAFAARDADALAQVLSPDVTWIQNEGFPGGGTHRGVEGVLHGVHDRIRATWEGWRTEVTEWIDAGACVVAIGTYRACHRATGRPMTAAFAHVLDLEGGCVVRFRQFTDTAQLVAAQQGESQGRSGIAAAM